MCLGDLEKWLGRGLVVLRGRVGRWACLLRRSALRAGMNLLLVRTGVGLSLLRLGPLLLILVLQTIRRHHVEGG